MRSEPDSAMLSSEGDFMMFLGHGIDENSQNTDLFYGTSPMVTESEEMGLLEASTRQPGSGTTSAKTESGKHVQPSHQTGSSPEELSEDSSSDDSARHKRKSSSMSFEISHDGDDYDFSKMWAHNGSVLGPALENDGNSHAPVQDIGSGFSNEDMEIHFDFKSAASSPRPFTTGNSKSAVSSFPADQRQVDELERKSGDLIGNTSAMSQSPPHMTGVKHESNTCRTKDLGKNGLDEALISGYKRHQHSSRLDSGSPIHRSTPQASPVQDSVIFANSTGLRSQLIIHPIPPKSRVETQIPVKITISSMPEGVKKLHLPTHTISKPKLVQRPKHERSPDTLELYSMLVCTSAMQDPQKRERALRMAASRTREQEESERNTPPTAGPYEADHSDNPLNGGEVHICSGCITRERKRAARKKSKKPEEEAAWASDEARRVVVFNTQEVRPWDQFEDDSDIADNELRGRVRPSDLESTRQIRMPMRIACYCRHHGEKLGFQVILTIKDYKDNLIAQDISQPIVITDDHKAQPPSGSTQISNMPLDGIPTWIGSECPPMTATMAQAAAPLQRNAFSSNDLQAFQQQMSQQPHPQPGFRPFASVQTTAYSIAPSNRPSRSRPASPSATGPTNKKRKSSTGPKIPESLVMTKSQVSPRGTNTGIPGAGISTLYHASTSATVSPYSSHFPAQTFPPKQQRTPSYPSGPPTPDSSTNDFFTQLHRSQSFEANGATQPIFSQPPSTIVSRVPSPVSSGHIQSGPNPLQRVVTNSTYTVPSAQLQQRLAVINKVIPTQGPISGGIEVTCLGSGFYQGIEVMFGDALATTTTYWGDSTLVCLLPPADRPGQVPVTLKHQNEQRFGSTRHLVNASFTYVDGSEHDMLCQALVILGQKITGRVEDAGDIIRHVMQSSQGGAARWSNYGSNSCQHGQSYSQRFGFSPEVCTEDAVLRCLELIDMDTSPFPAQLDLPLESGQTLLHLAASLGYHRLLADLITRGVMIDKRDRNGHSPMHMASLRGHARIVRRLRLAGGNPALRSHLGFRPAELATDPLVIRSLSVVSQGRFDARRINDLSARQIWGHAHRLQPSPPRSRTQSLSRYDAGDEWDETSSEEEDAESPQSASADYRGFSEYARLTGVDMSTKTTTPMGTDKSPRPAAAMALWRNQLIAQMHQLQQSMENLFSPIQLPNLSALPPMPNLPAYHTPAMVRRFGSLVPQRPPRSADALQKDPNGGEIESKWWDFFTGFQPPQASPPAYEEIYPHDPSSLDNKSDTIASIASNGKVAIVTGQSSAPKTIATKLDGAKIDLQAGTGNAARKRLRSDRNLFFVWIPMLLLLIMVALKDRFFVQSLSIGTLLDRLLGGGWQAAETI